MKILILLLLCTKVLAAGPKLEGENVLPFENKNYPLRQMIKDYAELMNLNVNYVDKVISDKLTLNLQLNSKVSKNEYKKIFFTLLDSHSFTPVEDNGFLWISESQQSRYIPSQVVIDNSYEKNASYQTVIYSLKFPLGNSICRNLRPYLSRYGRVINFSDAKTIIFLDKGDNISRVLKIVEEMDTEAAYKSIISIKPKAKEEAPFSREKLVDLEIQNKILEKKLVELKEEK